MLKWILRIVLGLVVVVVVTAGVSATLFASWRAHVGAERSADPDRRIATTALGDIEYAVLGEGTPMLLLPASPGGYVQALSAQRAIPELAIQDTMAIGVSRPGYLGTPLSSGATFAEQADLYAALLDELGVDRVVVMAWSGGGYAALQFALRHPERTRGLIFVSPTLAAILAPADPDATIDAVSTPQVRAIEVLLWVMDGPLGEPIISRLIPEFDPDDPMQADQLDAAIRTAIPFDPLVEGVRNDLRQRTDPGVADWPLEDIAAPALFFIGDEDADEVTDGSAGAAARIPNARLITYEGGDHFILLTRAREIHDEVEGFVEMLLQDEATG